MKELTAEYADGLAQSWATTHTALRAAGQRSVAVEAAAAAAAPASAPRPTGPLASLLPCAPLLLDVREPEKFSRLHPAGALGVPLYTRLEKPASAIDWLRTVSFAVIGFKPHVRNKSFVEQVSAAVGGNKRAPLFVICASGGTLETAAERKIRAPRIPAPIFGKYGAGSQSLMAIYALRQAGFTNLTHVEGGFSSWAYNGLPVEASP